MSLNKKCLSRLSIAAHIQAIIEIEKFLKGTSDVDVAVASWLEENRLSWQKYETGKRKTKPRLYTAKRELQFRQSVHQYLCMKQNLYDMYSTDDTNYEYRYLEHIS